MVKAYWRRVAARAWRTSIQTLGFESRGRVVTAFLSALAIAAVLLFWGSQDAAGDMALERTVIWALAISAFLFAYVWGFLKAPAGMENEAAEAADAKIEGLNERIEALENERRQILTFDFRPEDNKFFEIVNSREGGHYREFRIGRVAVKNLSNSKSVRDLQTTLIHYREDGGKKYNTVDILLSSYSSKQTVEDIPARRNVTYDLFRIKKEGHVPHISLGPLPDGSYKQIPTGRYRLKITASSTDMPPLTGFFLLDVKDSGKVVYGPWRDGDSSNVIST